MLEKETLLKDEIAEIFKGIKRNNNRPAWTGSATRVPSTVPPVALSPAAQIVASPTPSEAVVTEVDAKAEPKPAAKKVAKRAPKKTTES